MCLWARRDFRSDEPGSPIVIGDNCNVRDRVVIHALEDSSVLIGENISLAHGCIVHGSYKIGKKSFIGFGSVVFKSVLNDGVCVNHLVVVEGVDIVAGRIIESCQLVGCEDIARGLRHLDKKTKDSMEGVVRANLNLVKGCKK